MLAVSVVGSGTKPTTFERKKFESVLAFVQEAYRDEVMPVVRCCRQESGLGNSDSTNGSECNDFIDSEPFFDFTNGLEFNDREKLCFFALHAWREVSNAHVQVVVFQCDCDVP